MGSRSSGSSLPASSPSAYPVRDRRLAPDLLASAASLERSHAPSTIAFFSIASLREQEVGASADPRSLDARRGAGAVTWIVRFQVLGSDLSSVAPSNTI